MKKETRKRKTTGLLGPNILDMFKKMKEKDGEGNSKPDEDASEDEDNGNEKLVFQYKWLKTWLWMRYDKEKDAIFCKTCEAFAISASGPFTRGGSRNFKTSSFYDHAASKTHVAAEEKKSNAEKVKMPIIEGVQKMQSSVEGAVLNMFRAAYTVGVRCWSFNDYEYVVDLIDLVGCSAITKQLYWNDHACQGFIACIGDSLHLSIIEEMKRSPFFGVQVDESTDVATHQHLVLCVTYLEHGGQPKNKFLTILRVKKANAATLHDSLVSHLKEAGLDMTKLMGFGSDGASTMVGKKKGVAARLKASHPYMTSIHCIAHRTNLAVQDAAKGPDMKWIEEIETMVNSIAAHFSRSSLRLEKLQELLNEYSCAALRLEGIQETRWLSRHSAIAKLCEDLPAVLEYSRMENHDIFEKLANLKMIYLLHFLADILGGLTILSKMFQARNVDITVIAEHITTVIKGIQTYYIAEPEADLNASQHDSKGYPIVPDYGPPGGWLAALRTSIRGDEYRTFKLSRQIDGTDLEIALTHQKAYAKAVCDCLQVRFEDTSIMKNFNILSPLLISRASRPRKFGEDGLEELITFYGTPKKVKGSEEKALPLIDADVLRVEYADYKIHALANWQHKSMEDVCAMIASNQTNEVRFKNILTLLQISLVQCASNAICESIFSHRTNIKTRGRPLMGAESLNASLSIVVNGPGKARDFDFTKSIELWKKKADNRGRLIYTGEPSRYL